MANTLNGMRRILQAYRDNFGGSEQKAAWISGFYGSGKSHLAKVLRYLWINREFSRRNNGSLSGPPAGGNN